jgi:hypothetical protein
MEFVRVVSATKLQAAGLSVSLAVWNTGLHLVPLVQLVKKHKGSLLLRDPVIYPELPFRYEFIDVIVSSRREVDVENAPHQSTIYDPDMDTLLQPLPKTFMNGMSIRQLLPMAGCPSNVTRPTTLFTLDAVCFNECLFVRISFAHQVMLDKQVIDKERAFVMLRLLIDPELVVGNVRISVVLSKVRELLIKVSADIAAIHNPNLNLSASVILAKVGRSQRFCHITPFLIGLLQPNAEITCLYAVLAE